MSEHVTDVTLHPAADLPLRDDLKEKAALSIHSVLLEMMFMAQTACEIQEALNERLSINISKFHKRVTRWENFRE